MTAAELITHLAEVIRLHGDVPVTVAPEYTDIQRSSYDHAERVIIITPEDT